MNKRTPPPPRPTSAPPRAGGPADNGPIDDDTGEAGGNFQQLYPCERCPLNGKPHFRTHGADELRFLRQFKRGELQVGASTSFLVEGTSSPHLYTVLSGWGYRYKTLPDGRRQVLNYVMPGDFVGLQSSLVGRMEHSVQTLSQMLLCVFERASLPDLFDASAALAYDIVWIASREEQILEEHMLSIGRRTALERTAYLLSFLHERARRTGLLEQGAPIRPITQTHLADTLGLSLVHTNKTLKKLQERDLIRWSGRSVFIRDADELQRTAGWAGLPEEKRPFV